MIRWLRLQRRLGEERMKVDALLQPQHRMRTAARVTGGGWGGWGGWGWMGVNGGGWEFMGVDGVDGGG